MIPMTFFNISIAFSIDYFLLRNRPTKSETVEAASPAAMVGNPVRAWATAENAVAILIPQNDLRSKVDVEFLTPAFHGSMAPITDGVARIAAGIGLPVTSAKVARALVPMPKAVQRALPTVIPASTSTLRMLLSLF